MIRWLKFNTVGIAGAIVQLAALWCLAPIAGSHYAIATIIAVEISILHNFAWHEAWTWRGLPAETRMQRLFRFHVSNGFISIVSNTLLTSLFIQQLGVPLLPANLAAIIATSLLNFTLVNLWVLRT